VVAPTCDAVVEQSGRELHDDGSAQVDETAIFAAYARLRDREARAACETKRVRGARERRPATIAAASDTSRHRNAAVQQ